VGDTESKGGSSRELPLPRPPKVPDGNCVIKSVHSDARKRRWSEEEEEKKERRVYLKVHCSLCVVSLMMPGRISLSAISISLPDSPFEFKSPNELG
jgi:hypothetical protein